MQQTKKYLRPHADSGPDQTARTYANSEEPHQIACTYADSECQEKCVYMRTEKAVDQTARAFADSERSGHSLSAYIIIGCLDCKLRLFRL